MDIPAYLKVAADPARVIGLNTVGMTRNGIEKESISLIKKAYKQKYIPSFTDDATVLEKLGHSINLIKGEENNFKITYPHDIERAESLYQSLYG